MSSQLASTLPRWSVLWLGSLIGIGVLALMALAEQHPGKTSMPLCGMLMLRFGSMGMCFAPTPMPMPMRNA